MKICILVNTETCNLSNKVDNLEPISKINRPAATDRTLKNKTKKEEEAI
jgi:hypothetical protein